MPLYNVLFHTSTESLLRQFPAATADDCIMIAEAQFRMSNADHGVNRRRSLTPDRRPMLTPPGFG